MPHVKPDIPLGMRCVQKLLPNVVITSSKNVGSRGFILFLTYIIYTSYHASRKPLSVVKSQLHRNCSGEIPSQPTNNSNWCDWKPFDADDSNSLFGLLDSSFLFSYAFAMFFSGFVAERSNLRYFLSGGMLLSGVACYLFGIARQYDIHNIWYFVAVQSFGGIFQTTGWPGVVAVMGNWFGEGKTGFIFGVWNSHTSVGNILGTLVAGHFVETDWGYSFLTLAYTMMAVSVIVFLFLLPEPSHSQPRANGGRSVNTEPDDHSGTTTSEDTDDKTRVEQRPILTHNAAQSKPIGFIDALCVPGVMEFSLCLFFAKLVSYTFLYWLPVYIKASTTLGIEVSATLSTLFDVGGIFGGIFAGAVSDMTGLQACTCAFMIIASVPSLYMYYLFGGISLAVSIAMLLITGALVNGPYALITTAVSARLGVDPSLAENAKAISTVTAIIDGMGSIGAAVGPLLTGYVSDRFGWDYVFYMLMAADAFALLTLYRLVRNEVHRITRTRVHGWTN